MTPVRNASWIERTQRGVLVRLDGGTSVRISALAADVVRVLFLRPEGLQLDRTWTVLALGEDDVPWEGRDRMDKSSWPVPAFSVQEGDGCAELRTDALSVGIEFVPFRLVWRLPDGRVFAADRAHHPYMLGSGGAHAHAQVRDPGDFYCGLGDKTGPLNLYRAEIAHRHAGQSWVRRTLRRSAVQALAVPACAQCGDGYGIRRVLR